MTQEIRTHTIVIDRTPRQISLEQLFDYAQKANKKALAAYRRADNKARRENSVETFLAADIASAAQRKAWNLVCTTGKLLGEKMYEDYVITEEDQQIVDTYLNHNFTPERR